MTRFKKEEGGWAGGDGGEVRSAAGGSQWLMSQAPQQLAVQVRHVPPVRAFQEHSRERRKGET